MDDIYIWVAVGAIALAAAIWFDPTTRTKFRQKRFHDSLPDVEPHHENLTPVPLSELANTKKRSRRKIHKK